MNRRTIAAFVACLVFATAVGLAVAAQGVYYEPDIRDIIRKDCARCHSGALRNLMSWDSVRAYVDNGMLAAMVQGPMRQFCGPANADIITAWIDAGAPENPPRNKAGAAQAAFGQTAQAGAGAQAALSYDNGVRGLLAKDCLRCHLGPFRKLTSYEEVKAYAENGLLVTMVRPGGPMNRFAGADAQPFLAWIRAGSPR